MSLTLALDTSAHVCVGYATDAGAVIGASVDDPRAHAEQLMPLVVSTLAQGAFTTADVTAIVVGVGPGPFTGLRVGVVTALTLGEVLGVPVHGVCSLDAVAAAWVRSGAPEEFVVVSDARRREVYWARYSGGVRVEGPSVGAPATVASLPLAGPGAHLVGEASGPTTLDAGVLALVGSDLPGAGHEPLYLRRPDAEVPTTHKSTIPQARLAFGARRG